MTQLSSASLDTRYVEVCNFAMGRALLDPENLLQTVVEKYLLKDWTGEVAQSVGKVLARKPEALSSIPGTQGKEDIENAIKE